MTLPVKTTENLFFLLDCFIERLVLCRQTDKCFVLFANGVHQMLRRHAGMRRHRVQMSLGLFDLATKVDHLMLKISNQSKKIFLRGNVFKLKTWRSIFSSLCNFCIEKPLCDFLFQFFELLLLFRQFGRQNRHQSLQTLSLRSNFFMNLWRHVDNV